MANTSTADRVRSVLADWVQRAPTDGWRLDATVTVLSVLMLTGIVLDFRSHAAGISFAEEGFFTPEHTFFYSMFLGIAVVLFVATLRRRRQGASWLDAVPDGYRTGLAGVLVFGFAGVGDFLWHRAFGFEQSFEALVSPSHLLLAVGAVLFFASPLRAVWYRADRPRGVGLVPVVVPLALVLTIVSLFGAFVNPLVRPYPHYPWSSMQRGVAMLCTYPLVLVGAGLALSRRFRPPFGTFTLVFAVPALASSFVEAHPVLALPAVAAGLVADGVTHWRRPTPANPRALRLFGLVVPVVFAGTYFTVVELAYGIAHRPTGQGFPLWSPHVVGGAVALAGAAGLLLTYVAAPAPGRGDPA